MSFFERWSQSPPRPKTPPPRGTVRPREPSTPTPAPSGVTGNLLAPDTPTNDRELKKARHDAIQAVYATPGLLLKNLNAATALYQAGASPAEITAAATPRKADATAVPPPADSDDDVFIASKTPAASAPARADDYARLVTHLESAVACVTQLESRPGNPAYPARVRELLEELNSRARPRAAANATVDADAAAARNTRATAREREPYAAVARKGATTKQPARAARPAPATARDNRQGAPRAGRPAAPSPRSDRPPDRLVLRWPAGSAPAYREPPTSITTSLNTVLSIGSSTCIRGVNWSRAGNLVVHTRLPFTSSQVAAMPEFLPAVASALRHTVPPALDEAGGWHGVVINGVPGAAFWQEYCEHGDRVCGDIVSAAGLSNDQVKDVKVLCSEEAAGTKMSYSVRLMLASDDAAARLQRDGLFVMGTHCRVSRYRRRRGRAPRGA